MLNWPITDRLPYFLQSAKYVNELSTINYTLSWRRNCQTCSPDLRKATAPLTRLVQQWSESLDASKYVGVIFFDLQKAFDKVWHKGLLAKLSAAGISDSAFEWFQSYLSNRRQRTRVTDAISCPNFLFAGVPQGAILSPLLFSLYVNDIVNCVDALDDPEINLFADDTSFYLEDRSASSLSIRLQKSVNTLSAWFKKWLLSVNPQKTALLVLRTTNMQPLNISITIDGTDIRQVVQHKHLGVTFNDRLTWKDHVDTISTKAARKIGFLRRNRKRLPQIMLQHMYKTSILPALDYASVAWSGLSTTEKHLLERIQRKAARLITSETTRHDIPHDILLSRAGLPTLSSRREVEQIVFAFKFLHNLLPDHVLDKLMHWKKKKPERSASLRHGNQIRLPLPHKSVLIRSPLYSSLSLWNNLSDKLSSPPISVSALLSLLLSFS